MEGFNEKEGQLYVDDLPISEIADKYSTPAFIYSASLIRNNYNKYANALTEGDLICYAVKANSNIHILKELVKLGSGFDVVSGNELKRCIKAGADPKKIIAADVGCEGRANRLDGVVEIFSHRNPSQNQVRALF